MSDGHYQLDPRELDERADQACQRLARCRQYLAAGHLADAIAEVETPPDLLDECDFLRSKEVEAHRDERHETNEPVPPTPDEEVLRWINEAYEAYQKVVQGASLKQLLAQYRRQQLQEAPVLSRIQTVRALMARAQQPIWDGLLRDLLQQWAREMLDAGQAAASAGDRPLLADHLATLEEYAGEAAVDHVIGELRPRLAELVGAELIQAWQASDQATAEELADRLEALGFAPSGDAARALAWIRGLQADHENQVAYEQAITKLEDALDAGESAARLEQLCDRVTRTGLALPDDLADRVEAAIDAEAAVQQRKHFLKNAAIGAAAVLALVALGGLVHYVQREAAANTWSQAIAKARKDRQVEEARKLLADLTTQDPGLARHAKLEAERKRLEQAEADEARIKHVIDQHLAQAQQHLEAGRLADASEALKQATSARPRRRDLKRLVPLRDRLADAVERDIARLRSATEVARKRLRAIPGLPATPSKERLEAYEGVKAQLDAISGTLSAYRTRGYPDGGLLADVTDLRSGAGAEATAERERLKKVHAQLAHVQDIASGAANGLTALEAAVGQAVEKLPARATWGRQLRNTLTRQRRYWRAMTAWNRLGARAASSDGSGALRALDEYVSEHVAANFDPFNRAGATLAHRWFAGQRFTLESLRKRAGLGAWLDHWWLDLYCVEHKNGTRYYLKMSSWASRKGTRLDLTYLADLEQGTRKERLRLDDMADGGKVVRAPASDVRKALEERLRQASASPDAWETVYADLIRIVLEEERMHSWLKLQLVGRIVAIAAEHLSDPAERAACQQLHQRLPLSSRENWISPVPDRDDHLPLLTRHREALLAIGKDWQRNRARVDKILTARYRHVGVVLLDDNGAMRPIYHADTEGPVFAFVPAAASGLRLDQLGAPELSARDIARVGLGAPLFDRRVDR